MKFLTFLPIMSLLLACNPTVVFKEPQPGGKKDLKGFPSRVQGTYMEVKDSSIYLITAEIIYEKHEEILADPEVNVLGDEDLQLAGDTLIFNEMNLRFPIKRRNDSIFGPIVFYDTVFDIKGSCRLRKLGKDYFLNLPADSLWLVLKLSFNESGAFLCDIDHDKEGDIFDQHCNVEIQMDKEGKPKRYIMNPGMKEFKTLVKLETFTDTTRYIRLPE